MHIRDSLDDTTCMSIEYAVKMPAVCGCSGGASRSCTRSSMLLPILASGGRVISCRCPFPTVNLPSTMCFLSAAPTSRGRHVLTCRMLFPGISSLPLLSPISLGRCHRFEYELYIAGSSLLLVQTSARCLLLSCRNTINCIVIVLQRRKRYAHDMVLALLIDSNTVDGVYVLEKRGRLIQSGRGDQDDALAEWPSLVPYRP